MNLKSVIKNNSIYIRNNYFEPIMFEILKRKFSKFSYYATCQPENWKWLGNRFQGYPCYDCLDLSKDQVGTKRGQRLRKYLQKRLNLSSRFSKKFQSMRKGMDKSSRHHHT